VLLALALGAANGAAAIELQVVDSDKIDENAPAAQLPSGCVVSGANKFNNRFISTAVALETLSQGVITGTACDNSSQLTAGQNVTVNVLGAPGATAEICFVVRSAGTTVEQGSAAAQATLAGFPIATSGGVFLNGNPVNTINQQLNGNDSDGGSDRGLITVTVGDQIRLAAGTQVQLKVGGAGTASGDALVGAAIYVGACPLERAPVASPLGLAGLAAALAGLGALALGWRARGAR
jgi:hypothetical protein